MPLYEYQCESCDHRFERIQKFSDPPPDACPACGGPVKKLLSSPAIQFKGSGFYITDYAKKSSGGDSKSGGGKDGGGKDAAAPTSDGASTSSGSTDSGSGTDSGAKAATSTDASKKA